MNLKNAIITGGASGIGLKAVQELSLLGYRVYVIDKSNSVDIIDFSSIKKFISELQLDSLDILINSAGIFELDNFGNLTPETISRILDTNLKGTISVISLCLPLLQKSRCNPSVITISSGLAKRSDPNAILYCTTKAALIALNEGLALKYAQDGIRFNCILPGPIDTPMLRKFLPTDSELAEYKNLIPMKKIGTVDDVWNAINYLTSSKSLNVTGTCLDVSGGENIASVYS